MSVRAKATTCAATSCCASPSPSARWRAPSTPPSPAPPANHLDRCEHSHFPSLKGRGQGWVREALDPVTFEDMSRRIPFDQTQRARGLRNNATKHERKLWAMVSRLRPKFTRQLPLG